jgi:hypothetical protein
MWVSEHYFGMECMQMRKRTRKRQRKWTNKAVLETHQNCIGCTADIGDGNCEWRHSKRPLGSWFPETGSQMGGLAK